MSKIDEINDYDINNIEHVTNSKKWWSYILNQNHIDHTDGRPIYKYRLNDKLVSKACSILKYNKGIFLNKSPEKNKGLCGLFVCWASETFKRKIDSASPSWRDILTYLDIDLSVNQRTKIIEAGLQYLKIPVKKISGNREWLVTIQLLGGFPLSLFMNKKENWLKDYFSKILTHAFRFSEKINKEIALEIVTSSDHSFDRKSYQDDLFYDLAADFIYKLQNLKVEYAGNLQKNSSLVAKLDIEKQNWRDELPMSIPDESKSAIDKLLVEEIDKAARKPIILNSKIRRGLVPINNNLEAHIKIELSDEMIFDTNNRPNYPIALYAVDETSDYIPSQIAIAELPFDDKNCNFEVTQKLNRLIKYPLLQNVRLAWQDKHNFFKIIDNDELKGSLAPTGDILTFNVPENESGFYELIGSGSGSFPDKEILIVIKDSAKLIPQFDGEFKEFMGLTVNGINFKSYFVSGLFYIENDNVKYRIETNTISQNYDIVAYNVASSNWRSKNRYINLYSGDLLLKDNDENLKPKHGELLWRVHRDDEWEDYYYHRPKCGKIRVKWIDKNVGYVKVVKTIFLLPERINFNAEVEGNNVSVKVNDAPEFEIKICDEYVKLLTNNNGIFNNSIKSKISCDLKYEDIVLPIEVDCTLKRNCFVDINGTIIKNKNIMINKLIGSYAIAKKNPEFLRVTIKSQGKANGIYDLYEMPKSDIGKNPRLPLSNLEELIWELIGLETDPDVIIKIEFDSDGEAIEVHQFDKRLTKAENGGVVVLGGELDNQDIVFKPCLKPWQEYKGIEAKEATLCGYKRIIPPPDIIGPAIAYTRNGNYVTTRPFLACMDSVESANDFERICQIPEHDIRETKLKSWFNNPDNTQKATKLIIDTAKSLNGFPVTLLDLFRIEPTYNIMVQALIKAGDYRGCIYNLQKELPFSWYLIPMEIWSNAFKRFKEEIFWKILPIYGDATICMKEVNKYIDEIKGFLINNEQIFNPLFELYDNHIKDKESILKELEFRLAKLQGKCPQDVDYKPLCNSCDYDLIQGMFGGRFDVILDESHVFHNWFVAPFIAAEAIIDNRVLSTTERLGIWQARRTLDYWSDKEDLENEIHAQSGHAFDDALISIIQFKLSNK